MVVKYAFADGEKSEVEVDEDIGNFITESRRAEHANNERHRSHSEYSIDAMEGDLLAAPDTDPLDEIIAEINRADLLQALSRLTEVQRRRLMLLASGKSIAEITRIEGKAYHVIERSIESAQKKMKKNL